MAETAPCLFGTIGISMYKTQIPRHGTGRASRRCAASLILGCIWFAGTAGVWAQSPSTTPKQDLHAAAIEARLLRLRDENGQIPADAWLTAAQQAKKLPVDAKAWPIATDPQRSGPQPQIAGIKPSGWTWLGPGNIGGRVRAIVAHPIVPGTLWAGGVDGGVWKTVDGGASWFPQDDFMANLAVCSLALDPNNPEVLYAGTGEGFNNGDAVQGAGIFKSVDGGTNWTLTTPTNTANFQFVNRLAISPNNSSNLLAATRTGIFRTRNGGTSWTRQLNLNNGIGILDVQFHPTDDTQCIAGGYTNAYFSTNGGGNWVLATGIPAPTNSSDSARVELAYAPSSPTTVYASVDRSYGEIYVSTDGGQTYTLKNTGAQYLSSQGWYDNAIWVDPTNPTNVVVGGTDLYLSMDGGTTLNDIGGYPGGVHPDQHIILSLPGFDGVMNSTVLVGNDGGIYMTTNIYTANGSSGWQSLNHNLGITQFYGVAGNATSGTVVGGCQDNGTLRYTPTNGAEDWTAWYGGDGGFCAVDQSNTNYYYGEYTYLSVFRSSDGAASASDISYGIGDAGYLALFTAPFILDPNNQNTMLAGGSSLWRSTAVRAPTVNWTTIKSPLTYYWYISAIAVAPGNSDMIWIGYEDGEVYMTTNGTAASPAWSRVGASSLPSRYCARVTVDPLNSNTAYAVFGGFSSGNVWRTTDLGQTWSNLSTNLPQAPVNSLVVHPLSSKLLYIGTEVGIFASPDGGVTWSASNDGPANVAVDELSWMGLTLLAGTHGRGCYSIAVGLPPTAVIPQPTNETVLTSLPASFSITASGTAPFGYQWLHNGVAIAGATDTTYSLAAAYPTNAGNYSVIVTNGYGSTTSAAAILTVVASVPLATALDNATQTWVTNATTPWYGQTSVYHNNGSAGRSYFIGDSQQTTLGTAVTGPGSITFWWKVSSQTNADYLSVLLYSPTDVQTMNQISGEVNWQYQQIYFGAGSNYIEWTYSKDASGSSGRDAGYVDLVKVNVGGALPTISTQPLSQSVFFHSPVSLTVAAQGTPTITYQWLFNGSVIAGATKSAYSIASATPSQAGIYSVVIANPFGVTNSANAVVTVIPVVAAGDNSFHQASVPNAASGAIAISAGDYHSLAIGPAGQVVAWGLDYAGQCDVPALSSMAVGVAAGGYHSLALKLDGTVVGWGANDSGQTNIPSALSNVVAIAAGEAHSLALRADGRVFAWGDNSSGQTNLPPGLTNIVAIAAGGNHSLALRADGTVAAWGDNLDAYGGYAGQSTVPKSLSNVVAIAAGQCHSLAVLKDGSVTAWGDNSDNQSQPPVLTNAVAVAGGSLHSLALKSDGSVVGWGNDWSGQYDFPSTLPTVLAIAAGSSHSLVRVGDQPAAPTILYPRQSAAQFSLLVQSLAGKHYSLQYQTNLTDAAWTSGQTNYGNGSPQFLIDSSPEAVQRFYRVQQQ